MLDDGKPVPIDTVRFLGAADYAGDTTLAPIRTHQDEEREASRDASASTRSCSTAPWPVAVSGRLLDRRGQPLTDLRLTPDTATPELRLAPGSLGPGEYVIELAQQFIAFRVVR